MSRRPGLLRHADFRYLWASQTISSVGTQVTVVAMPMLALVLLKTSPLQTTLLAAFEFLPFLLIGLPAGVWIDRLPIRPILITVDLGRALALCLLPVAHWLGFLSLPLVYAAVFVVGGCTVFSDIGHQSMLPALLDDDQVVEGNAKLQTSLSMSQLAGPTVGGFLVSLVSAPAAILADSVSYLFSAGFLSMIRTPETRAEQPPGEPRSLRREVGEGLWFVLGNPVLRALAICTALANLAFGGVLAVIVMFGTRTLHLAPGLVGVAVAIGNAGGLLAAAACEPIRKRYGFGGLILVGVLVFNAGAWLLPLANGLAGFGLALFITFMGVMVYNIGQVSLRQIVTPRNLQGRMNATMRFVMWGTIPLGAALAGVIADGPGIRDYLWTAAALNATALLPLLLTPRVLRKEPPTAPAAPAAQPDLATEGAA